MEHTINRWGSTAAYIPIVDLRIAWTLSSPMLAIMPHPIKLVYNAQMERKIPRQRRNPVQYPHVSQSPACRRSRNWSAGADGEKRMPISVPVKSVRNTTLDANRCERRALNSFPFLLAQTWCLFHGPNWSTVIKCSWGLGRPIQKIFERKGFMWLTKMSFGEGNYNRPS